MRTSPPVSPSPHTIGYAPDPSAYVSFDQREDPIGHGTTRLYLPKTLPQRKVWGAFKQFCATSLPMLASSTGTGLFERYVNQMPFPAAICAPAIGVEACKLIISYIHARREGQQNLSSTESGISPRVGNTQTRCSKVAKAVCAFFKSSIPVFASSALTGVMGKYSSTPFAANILSPPVALSILIGLGLALKSCCGSRSSIDPVFDRRRGPFMEGPDGSGGDDDMLSVAVYDEPPVDAH